MAFNIVVGKPKLEGTPLEIAQEIFNRQSKQHFAQARGEELSCVMQDSKGNKCAFGCLIPQEMIVPLYGVKVCGVLRGNGVFPGEVFDCTKEQKAVILAAQKIHDASNSSCDARRAGFAAICIALGAAHSQFY